MYPTVRSREWPIGCGASGRPRAALLMSKKPVGGSLRGRRVALTPPSCSRPVRLVQVTARNEFSSLLRKVAMAKESRSSSLNRPALLFLDQVDEAVVILGRHREKIALAWEPIAIFDRCLDLSPASLADARSRINPRAPLAPP